MGEDGSLMDSSSFPEADDAVDSVIGVPLGKRSLLRATWTVAVELGCEQSCVINRSLLYVIGAGSWRARRRCKSKDMSHNLYFTYCLY